MTRSFTKISTFTRTNAKYIASKIAADLQGMKDYYGKPNESWISDYDEELTELLVGGYLESVEYGFMQNGQRVVTLYYEVQSDGSLSDEKSGGVYARTNISGAKWFSFLIYNLNWTSLSDTDRQKIKARIPIKRTTGQEPQDGNGHWVTDREYSSQGVGTQRRTFRPY